MMTFLSKLPWVGPLFVQKVPSVTPDRATDPQSEVSKAGGEYHLAVRTVTTPSVSRAPTSVIASTADVRAEAIRDAGPGWATALRGAGVGSYKVKSGTTPGVETALFVGDMTSVPADAYGVPHFRSEMRGGRLSIGISYGGVGGAMVRAGAEPGMKRYEDVITVAGREQAWGEVTITEAGGSKAHFLVNMVSVGSGVDEEFAVVQQSIFMALAQGSQQGIDRIVFPLMGTGIIGKLTAEQSAKAMLSALARFRAMFPESLPRKVLIAIYGDQRAFQVASKVLDLDDAALLEVTAQTGMREFDFEAWRAGIEADYGVDPVALGFTKE